MSHDPEKYLYDMLSSTRFLLEFTKTKSVEDYKKERAFRSAIERELQIIGEALLQLDHAFPQVAEKIAEHRNIIGFRHVLVHGYDNLDPATVWNVIEAKLPVLEKQLSALLKSAK